VRAGRPPRLIVSGEIDESTYPGLVSALADAADGQREVHVNLAGVGIAIWRGCGRSSA